MYAKVDDETSHYQASLQSKWTTQEFGVTNTSMATNVTKNHMCKCVTLFLLLFTMALILCITSGVENVPSPTAMSLTNFNTQPIHNSVCSFNHLTSARIHSKTLYNIHNCPHILSTSAINKSAIFVVCQMDKSAMTNYAIIYNLESRKSSTYYKPNAFANILHVQYLPLSNKTYKTVNLSGKYAIMQDSEIVYTAVICPSTILQGKEAWFLINQRSVRKLKHSTEEIILASGDVTFVTYIQKYDVILLGSQYLLQGYYVSSKVRLFSHMRYSDKSYMFNGATTTPCKDAAVLIEDGGDNLIIVSHYGKIIGNILLTKLNTMFIYEKIASISSYDNVLFIGTKNGILAKLEYNCRCVYNNEDL